MKKIMISGLFLFLISFSRAQDQKSDYSIAKAEKNNVHVQKKDWSGTWQTDWGEMVLTQRLTIVQGTYEKGGGNIKGVLTDNGKVFKGRWSKPPSHEMPDDAGEIEFTLNSDDSFTAKWRNGTSGAWTTWTGTRKK